MKKKEESNLFNLMNLTQRFNNLLKIALFRPKSKLSIVRVRIETTRK